MEKQNQKGQALITLLFFTIIATAFISSAVAVIIVNSISGSKVERGEMAYSAAEGGAENGLLRVLRNPSYTGETGLAVGNGTVDISVSKTISGSTTNYVITSVGNAYNFKRTIEVDATWNGQLTVTAWKEL